MELPIYCDNEKHYYPEIRHIKQGLAAIIKVVIKELILLRVATAGISRSISAEETETIYIC